MGSMAPIERMTIAGTLAVLLVLAIGGLFLWAGGKDALDRYTTMASIAIPSITSLYVAHAWGQTRSNQAQANPPESPTPPAP